LLKRSDVAGVGIGLLLAVGTAHAATPEQRCQSAKNKAAGKYVVCRQSAEAKLATRPGDPIDLQKYLSALTRCATVYNRGWQKAIDKATSAGAVCPDAPLTAADFQAVIDDHTDNIATGLTDGSLTHCGNGIIDFAEEARRLEKELQKLSKDLDQAQRKLSNEDFLAKAPAEAPEPSA